MSEHDHTTPKPVSIPSNLAALGAARLSEYSLDYPDPLPLAGPVLAYEGMTTLFVGREGSGKSAVAAALVAGVTTQSNSHDPIPALTAVPRYRNAKIHHRNVMCRFAHQLAVISPLFFSGGQICATKGPWQRRGNQGWT